MTKEIKSTKYSFVRRVDQKEEPTCAHHEYKIVSSFSPEQHGRGNHEIGVKIRFQKGPLQEVGPNGVMNEDLIIMIIDRLQGFQESKFRCRENAVAITKLEEALMWLRKRTQDREERGVEGTYQV